VERGFLDSPDKKEATGLGGSSKALFYKKGGVKEESDGQSCPWKKKCTSGRKGL